MSKQKEIYSSFKAAYHLDKLQQMRNGELILPTQIQLDLTNKCNHDCVYCFYHGVNKNIVESFDRRASIPFPSVLRLINDMGRLKIPALQITGGGEPLVYPQIKEVLDAANKTELELAMVSNGALLTDDIISRLHRLAWIRLSVDAATEATYALTQKTKMAEFKTVTENIKKLKKELKDTVVGVSFVINPINYKEIYQACKLFKDLGADNVRLSIAYTDDQNKIFESFMSEMVASALKARELNDENFRVFDLGHTHLVHLESKKKYKVCGYSHLTAAIEANGIVRPCCTLKGATHSNFGNINDSSFDDIWFGDVRKEWVKNFDVNSCVLCWMDDKNEFIEYIINDKKTGSRQLRVIGVYMKIIDCFMFFNELDLLEIRLDYLNPKVDYFVLVEAKFTQLGDPKELFFENNKERYSKYLDKIVHVVVDNPVTHVYASHENENYQREQIMVGLGKLSIDPEDIIIISDLDEIPSIDGIEHFTQRSYMYPAGMDQDMYYYYLNYKASYQWQGPMLVPFKAFSQGHTPQTLRNMRAMGYRIPTHGGWHFSYLGGAQTILTKITSVYESIHHEQYKDINIIQKAIDNNILFFNEHPLQKVDVEKAIYLQSLLQNRTKYQHLFKV